MSEESKQSPGERAILAVARAILWVPAALWPRSSWASLHKRIAKLQGRPVRDPTRKRAVASPKRNLWRFAFLIGLAFTIWLVEVLRKPAPAREVIGCPA